ncbi:MAG: hypothetical protein ACM3X7_02640 [Solirubrobacterales bacterium]
MHKGRRVGTLTAGIVLVMSGVMYLSHLAFPNIDYLAIVSFWPVILIILGIEIIASYIINKEEKLLYDTGAIWIMVVLSFFAMGMGGAEFIIRNISTFRCI